MFKRLKKFYPDTTPCPKSCPIPPSSQTWMPSKPFPRNRRTSGKRRKNTGNTARAKRRTRRGSLTGGERGKRGRQGDGGALFGRGGGLPQAAGRRKRGAENPPFAQGQKRRAQLLSRTARGRGRGGSGALCRRAVPHVSELLRRSPPESGDGGIERHGAGCASRKRCTTSRERAPIGF